MNGLRYLTTMIWRFVVGYPVMECQECLMPSPDPPVDWGTPRTCQWCGAWVYRVGS